MEKRNFGGIMLMAVTAVAGPLVESTWPNPTQTQIWVAWAVLAVLFLIGTTLAMWPTKPKLTKEARKSVFAQSTGESQIDIADSFSTADVFADAKDSSRITANRVHHSPGRTGDSRIPSEGQPE